MAKYTVEMLKYKLVVFDLDQTLWPFRLDRKMKSPFQIEGNKVIDSCGQEAVLLKDALPSLQYLTAQGYQLGIASRIEDICGAYQLINLLGIAQYFHYREIYPGCKMKHFRSLQQKSNIDFKEMVFFDDDRRNIRDVSRLGVTAIHTPDGISEPAVRNAVFV